MVVNFKLEAFKSYVVNRVLLNMKEDKNNCDKNSSKQFMKSP